VKLEPFCIALASNVNVAAATAAALGWHLLLLRMADLGVVLIAPRRALARALLPLWH